ncbi:MAG: UDP-N-acetylglucosamine 4,6-dehydratase family protein, partial [Bacteroidota bacterium]
VTGAGGSVGSELCRQIAAFDPERLLLVDRAEAQVFRIQQELIEKRYRHIIVPIVADILDVPRMWDLFQNFHPGMVFHAAAHKHVPLMESQPGEAIRNNTHGTVGLARLALEFGVDRFVFVSTDKAINPTSVMGATKRLAEIYLQALFASQPQKTTFVSVRLGNVLGSSGSVIPIFQKQIAAGGPVTVTHPEVKRYFMTVTEAAGLVMQCGAQAMGGEIFVLDMGQPVRIVQLARQMIELSGLKLDEDIKIEFIGLRPGEKLYEELCYHDERHTPTSHPRIMCFTAEAEPFFHVNRLMQDLMERISWADSDEIKRLLKRAVPEYQPYLDEPDTWAPRRDVPPRVKSHPAFRGTAPVQTWVFHT